MTEAADEDWYVKNKRWLDPSSTSPAECDNGAVLLPNRFSTTLNKSRRIEKPNNEEEPNWANPDIFGEPVMFGKIETPEISSVFLPTWVKEYVDAVVAQTQTPPAMAVMVVLSVLAACFQKRYEVSARLDSYTEQLALWTIAVLPPASRKTAVLTLLTQPINEWEKKQAQELAQAVAEAETLIDISKSRITELSRRASKQDDVVARSKLLEEIASLKENMLEPIVPPKIYVTDATPEAIELLLVENKERISLISDEGGIFEILSGLYSDGRANIDVFLKGHSGGPLRVKRSNRCTDLVKIALTIGLTVQPTVIEDLARGGKQIFRGKGLLGRPLYVIPRSNIGTRDVRLNVAIPPDVQKAYSNGIKTLLSIPRQLDENGIEVARILALSPEALDSWHRFAQWIEVRQGEGKEFERIQDWTGKLPGHALRIAALCHLAERLVSSKFTSSPLSPSSLEGDSISKATMEAALDLCEKLIVHAQAAFDLLESEESISDAKYAFKWLLANREKDDRGAFFIRQNALHSCSRFKKSKLERVTRALEMLRERNIVSAQFKLPTRKPTLIFYVNPSVCEGGTQ